MKCRADKTDRRATKVFLHGHESQSSIRGLQICHELKTSWGTIDTYYNINITGSCLGFECECIEPLVSCAGTHCQVGRISCTERHTYTQASVKVLHKNSQCHQVHGDHDETIPIHTSTRQTTPNNYNKKLCSISSTRLDYQKRSPQKMFHKRIWLPPQNEDLRHGFGPPKVLISTLQTSRAFERPRWWICERPFQASTTKASVRRSRRSGVVKGCCYITIYGFSGSNKS